MSRFKRFSIKSITASCCIALNMHESVKIFEVKFGLHGICPTCRRFFTDITNPVIVILCV